MGFEPTTLLTIKDQVAETAQLLAIPRKDENRTQLITGLHPVSTPADPFLALFRKSAHFRSRAGFPYSQKETSGLAPVLQTISRLLRVFA